MKTIERLRLLHDRRQAVIDLLVEQPNLSRTEIVKRIGWASNADTAKVFLRQMTALGEIVRKGRLRPTYTAVKPTAGEKPTTRSLDALIADYTEVRKRAGKTKSATAATARSKTKAAKGESDDDDGSPYTVPTYVNGRLSNTNPRRPAISGQTGAQGGHFGAIRKSGSYMESAG